MTLYQAVAGDHGKDEDPAAPDGSQSHKSCTRFLGGTGTSLIISLAANAILVITLCVLVGVFFSKQLECPKLQTIFQQRFDPSGDGGVSLTLSLRSGAVVMGKPSQNAFWASTLLGVANVSWGVVRTIAFHNKDDGMIGNMTLVDGSVMVGDVDFGSSPAMTLETTELGVVVMPEVDSIEKIEVRPITDEMEVLQPTDDLLETEPRKAWLSKENLTFFPVAVPYDEIGAPTGMPFEVYGSFRATNCKDHVGIVYHVRNPVQAQTFSGYKVGLDSPTQAIHFYVSQATSYYHMASSVQSGLCDGKWHDFVGRVTKETISVQVDGVWGSPVPPRGTNEVQNKEFGRVVHWGPYTIGNDPCCGQYEQEDSRVFVGELKNLFILDLS